MKGQRVRCEIKRRGDCAGLDAFRSRLNEQAENVETIILSESGQRRNGILFFHISTNIEMFGRCQGIFQRLLKRLLGAKIISPTPGSSQATRPTTRSPLRRG